jgi:HIRAN domain
VARRIDALRVTWAHPETGERLSIGVLRRESARFSFDRLPDYLRAKEAGFWTPELDEAAHLSSAFLFALFAQRIPSKSRPDFERMMLDWGVTDPDDRFEILAASGGRLKSDRIELFEERAADDPLTTPLRFRVAGVKHSDGWAYVKSGDTLELRTEPTNAQDSEATLVLLCDGRKLGYVPRPYASLFSKLLREGAPLQAKAVRELNIPGDEHRWVAEAWRA